MMCPAGTFSNTLGLTAESSCTPCTAGYYCPRNGQTSVDTVNNKCEPGYICAAGSVHPRAVLCPKGYICPNTSPALWDKQPCDTDATGLYMDEYGGTVCKSCPFGYECLDSNNPTALTGTNLPKDTIKRCQPQNEGPSYYCPPNKAYKVACPAGTFTF
jgi:hypothetical protein